MPKWGWDTKMTELVNVTRFGCLSNEFKFKRLCENEMRRCLYKVYQLSILISIYENKLLTGSV